MPKYGNSAQTPEIEFFEKLLHFQMPAIIMLPMRLQRLLYLGPKCPNMEIRPGPPNLTFLKNCCIFRCLSILCFQRDLNHYPSIIFGQIMRKCPQNHCLSPLWCVYMWCVYMWCVYMWCVYMWCVYLNVCIWMCVFECVCVCVCVYTYVWVHFHVCKEI